jgi:hypothetical protein
MAVQGLLIERGDPRRMLRDRGQNAANVTAKAATRARISVTIVVPGRLPVAGRAVALENGIRQPCAIAASDALEMPRSCMAGRVLSGCIDTLTARTTTG